MFSILIVMGFDNCGNILSLGRSSFNIYIINLSQYVPPLGITLPKVKEEDGRKGSMILVQTKLAINIHHYRCLHTCSMATYDQTYTTMSHVELIEQAYKGSQKYRRLLQTNLSNCFQTSCYLNVLRSAWVSSNRLSKYAPQVTGGNLIKNNIINK